MYLLASLYVHVVGGFAVFVTVKSAPLNFCCGRWANMLIRNDQVSLTSLSAQVGSKVAFLFWNNSVYSSTAHE